MVVKFKQEDGSYLIPYEIPMPGQKNDEDEVDSRAELIKDARRNGYKIDFVKLGYRIFKAVLVPGTETAYRVFYRAEMKEQRENMEEGRCFIHSDRYGLVRCPMYVPNPEYDEITNPDVPKEIKNDCDKCHHKKVNMKHVTFSDLEKEDEDGNPMPYEVPTGMMPDAERYEKACKEVLALIAKKYPERLEEFKLRLSEYNRKETADALGSNTSTVYKLPKGLKNDLLDLFDNLVYIDINTDEYR